MTPVQSVSEKPDRPDVHPTYAAEAGWRRIQALLPEDHRLDASNSPTEEWLTAEPFSVHLDCWRRPGAPATLVLIHGGGGNGRLLSPYGAMAATAGYEVVAPDLPGYGLTEVPSKRALVFEDWRDTVAAVLESQRRRTDRPIIIFGLSMGGMLAYDATARTRIPSGLVATCLLDPRDPLVRRSMVRWPWMGPIMEPLLSAAPALTDSLPVPMRLAGNMRGVANTAELAETIATDPRAGGSWMPARFLRTFANSGPLASPDSFDVCPVLLAHPADDRWTDISVTQPFFDRLRVAKRLVMLDNAGHLPVEEPGATQLRTALLDFLAERSRVGSSRQ
jgi:alpha-beta hydrolase superfamily lysophospholipase